MKLTKKLLAAVILAGSAVSAFATPIYAGFWDLFSGAEFFTHPPTYTAQEAAAELFGGVASDYLISTAGDDVGAINQMAWYDRSGIGMGMYAQDYRVDGGVLGVYDVYGDSSAMVLDNGWDGPHFNFAFRVERTGADVPEPLSLSLMGMGLASLAAARRRRSKAG